MREFVLHEFENLMEPHKGPQRRRSMFSVGDFKEEDFDDEDSLQD